MAGHRFKPEKAAKLLDPSRQKYIPIEQVLSLLDIHTDETVADFGCGNGYLTLPIASRASKVYGVDIEPLMLEALKERVEAAGLNNVSYNLSNLEEVQLETSSVNKGVAAFVTHEIPDLDRAINEFKRILKPEGILLVIDWEAVDMEVGPPLHERISSQRLKEQLEKHGLVVQTGHLNEGVYFCKSVIKKEE